MADTIAMMQGREASEPGDRATEDGGLISRVSAAGYQVAQAVDGLEQAVGLLRAAEELARDADARRRVAEQRLAGTQTEVAELTDLLTIARAAQADGDERARAAEQRLTTLQGEIEQLTDMVRVARAAQGDADERARAADQRFAGVRGEIEELTGLVAAARAAQSESNERAHAADQRFAGVRGEIEELTGLVAAARAAQAESDERARLADEQARLSDERARLAEDRFERVSDRTTAMELALGDLEDRWRSAETTPQVTLVGERDELQAAVAAEIRRPLTSILGLTLALKQADVKANDGKHMVRQLGTNAKRLERLVEQMLDLDKIANGTYEPKRRRSDLAALVGRVAEETPDIANRDLKIAGEHVAIEVDPGLTEQMVETLLSNAGRRTAPGGRSGSRSSPKRTGRSSRSTTPAPMRCRRCRATGKQPALGRSGHGPPASRSSPVWPSCMAAGHGSRSARAAVLRSGSSFPAPPRTSRRSRRST